MEAELMQNLFLVGAGPSSKTCPKWEPHSEQVTSVRIMPGRGFMRSKRFAPTNLAGVRVKGCFFRDLNGVRDQNQNDINPKKTNADDNDGDNKNGNKMITNNKIITDELGKRCK